jgi:hypothetical protein
MKHGYQVGAEHIRWVISRLTNLDAVRPLNIFQRVATQLRRGDRVIISMFSLKDFRGHSVLAYDVKEGRDGAPHQIFVADPNVPWNVVPGKHHPSFVEIYPNNTFKFITNGQTSYQSSRVVEGLLPGTVMYDTPFHIVASQPQTPFWEILQGLFSLVGGLIILGGEAETEYLSGDGASFYTSSTTGREISPNAISGLARIPLLDYQGQAPELYAQRGRLPDNLEFSVRGHNTNSGKYRLGVRTAQNGMVFAGPITSDSRDQIRLSGTRSFRPLLTASSEMETKVINVKYAVYSEIKERNGWSVETELGLAREAQARLSAIPDGLGILIENAGSEQPRRLNFVTLENGRPSHSTLTLAPELSRGTLRMTPEDLVSPHGNLVIERLSSIGGEVLERFRERLQPMP